MLQVPPIPIFTWLFFLFILVIYWKKSKAKGQIHKLPPGPWKLPVIGHLHHLVSSLPHRCMRDLAQKYGPIMQLQMGEVLAVVISSPKAAKEVLKTHDPTFANRASVLVVEVMTYDNSSMIFAPYGDYWRQMRKICVLELLSTKRVQSFRSIREEEVLNLIESISLSKGLPINLSEKIFSSTYSIASRAAFGNKCKYEKEFISLMKESFLLSGGFHLPDLFPSIKFLSYLTGMKFAMEKIHKSTDRILNNIVNEHKMKRSHTSAANKHEPDYHDDLVDVLLKLQETSDLEFHVTTNHIKAIILKSKAKGQIHKLPPGPWKLPVIGHLHHLVSSLPHRCMRDLAQKYGPIMQLQMGEVLAVVISSPKAAKEVLKTHDPTFANRASVLVVEVMTYDNSSMIFAPYGDYWRQMRKICVLELLSTKRVQSFRSIREEEVLNLIESISLSKGLPINLSEKIFSSTYSIASRAAFGNKCKYEKEFISLMKESFLLSGGFHLPDLFPSIKFLSYLTGMKFAMEKIHKSTDRILNNIVNEHKMKRSHTSAANKHEPDYHDDLVDVLLKLQETSDLEFHVTTNHIKAIILLCSFSSVGRNSVTLEEKAPGPAFTSLPPLVSQGNHYRLLICSQQIILIEESAKADINVEKVFFSKARDIK
nr:premnaspirodiene oxygenase [Quercus suber]